MVRKFSKETKEEKLKHQARHISIREGIFNSINSSLGPKYLSPFAIAINSSNSMIAMLTSISGILGPLSQTFGSKLIEKYPRKKIILKSVLLEALAWVPIIAVGILFLSGILTEILPVALLIFFSFHVILVNFGHPAWFSWMGDLVDEKYRGRWFSKRTLIMGFVSVIISIISAFMLDYFKKQGSTIWGFVILFSLAIIFRILAWNTFKKQYEPKLKLKRADYFSFWDFAMKLPETNFGKFTIFRGLLYFAISMITPLIAIYLLRVLNFSYIIYVLIMTSGAVFAGLFLELWGKIADEYGNYKVIIITSIIIPIIPILWILSPSPAYLIFVPSAVSGIIMSGLFLASGNFIYDNVSPQKRGLVVSYFNMMMGIGIFLGAGLGAILIKTIKTKTIEPILVIFIIGSIIAMVVVHIFLPRIREVRKAKKFKTDSIKKIIFHETGSTIIEEARHILHMKKYIHS